MHKSTCPTCGAPVVINVKMSGTCYAFQPPPARDGLTHAELIAACRNLGVDLTCRFCAALFYTGYTGPTERHDLAINHSPTCKTELPKICEANAKNSAELHMMNAKERAYVDRIKKLEAALSDIYRATLPAGTVRASEVEHIAERHGVAEGLREQ